MHHHEFIEFCIKRFKHYETLRYFTNYDAFLFDYDPIKIFMNVKFYINILTNLLIIKLAFKILFVRNQTLFHIKSIWVLKKVKKKQQFLQRATVQSYNALL